MNRKTLAKKSILIYPIYNSEKNHARNEAKLRDEKNPIKPEIFVKSKTERILPNIDRLITLPRSDWKKLTYPLINQKLFKVNNPKDLCPKMQNEWIDKFIDSIKDLKINHSVVKSFERDTKIINDKLKEILKPIKQEKRISKGFKFVK